MTKTFRRDRLKAAFKSQDFLRKKLAKGKLTDEDDVIFGIVKRHGISVLEFAHLRTPIQVEQTGEPNRYAMALGKNELRLYNKRHKHNQEIVSGWFKDVGPTGKNIKRSLLHISFGNFADEPIRRSKLRKEGEEEKIKRLEYSKRNGRKVKQNADALEKRIYA